MNFWGVQLNQARRLPDSFFDTCSRIQRPPRSRKHRWLPSTSRIQSHHHHPQHQGLSDCGPTPSPASPSLHPFASQPVLVTPGDTQFSHLSLPHTPRETLAWIRNPHPISAHSTSFSRTRLPEQTLPAPHSPSRDLSCHTPVTCIHAYMSCSELLRLMRI